MYSDRGALQLPLDFAREEEWARNAKRFRPEPTDRASTDQPALDASGEDALMKRVVDPANLQRAWRQVKRNRGAPGPDGMTIREFEGWAHENWAVVRQQLLDGTYRPGPRGPDMVSPFRGKNGVLLSSLASN